MARGLLILGAVRPASPPAIASAPALASAPSPYSIGGPWNEPSNNKTNQRLTVLALAIASTLAIVFLLLIYYVVLLRHRSSLRRRRRRRLIRTLTSNNSLDGDDDVGNHHAWHIRTVGLDQEVIDAIPVLKFEKDGTKAVDVCDCAVCLSEFDHGELLRLLPKCGHAFHVQCIDTWLQSHVSCPLCRAPVAPQPVDSTEGDDDGSSAESSEVGGAEAVVEAPENLEGASQISQGPVSLVKVSNGGTESSGESSAHGSSFGDAPEPPLSDLEGSSDQEGSASEGRQLVRDEYQASPYRVSHLMAVVPVQRSVSMDSSLSVTSLPTIELCGSSDGKELALGKQLVVLNEEKQENIPKGTSESKSPVEMARSLSGSGGNFLLSRFGRARSSSILPL